MHEVCVFARVQEQLDAERDARRRADEAVARKGAQVEEEARRRAEAEEAAQKRAQAEEAQKRADAKMKVLQVWACQING